MELIMDSHELRGLANAELYGVFTFDVFSRLCFFFNEMSCKKVPNIYYQLSGDCSGCNFLIVTLRVLLLLARNLFLKRVT